MSLIAFFTEEIVFSLKDKKRIRQWLIECAEAENATIETISYVFCSDDYLLGINKEYLNHDYYTDIITFNNTVEPGEIMADIFISVDRVRENAIQFEQSFESELHRVLIHGLLHLCGYCDKEDADQKVMRQKEDTYISLL